MTALAQLNAGSRILASEVRGVAPLSAYKASTETVSINVGTLQADDALFLPVLANASYLFELNIDYSGGAGGSSDFKFGWTFPTGLTMLYNRLYTTTGGVLAFSKTVQTDVIPAGTAGTGTVALLCRGTVSVGPTAGTLQFEWCQNSGAAVATSVLAGADLSAWQIA